MDVVHEMLLTKPTDVREVLISAEQRRGSVELPKRKKKTRT